MRCIEDRLKDLADKDGTYREFNTLILATVAPETVVGARTPKLRRLAGEIDRSAVRVSFLNELPHGLFEENQLHAFLLCRINSWDEAISRIDAFLPFVDNWATCDAISPKAFTHHQSRLFVEAQRWIADERTYVVRFGISVLMKYLLADSYFRPEMLELAARADEHPYVDRPKGTYYVRMMISWYFACAINLHKEDVLPWLEQRRLGRWVHNKTIQKAVESRRVPEQTKIYLKTLRWH